MVTFGVEKKTDNKKLFGKLEKIAIGAMITVTVGLATYSKIRPEAWHEFNEQAKNSGNDWTYFGLYAGFNLLMIGATYYFSKRS